MTRPKITWSDADFVAVMKSPEVEAVLLDEARSVASRAGAGFEAELGAGGKTRSRAFVRPVTGEAIGKNARDARLLRALGR